MEINELQRTLEELKAKGWSFDQIADAMGIHRATVYRWRQGMLPDQERAVVAALKRLLARKGPPRRGR